MFCILKQIAYICIVEQQNNNRFDDEAQCVFTNILNIYENEQLQPFKNFP
jgi:meiotically up-regulated gene 157 (Mug157) protein